MRASLSEIHLAISEGPNKAKSFRFVSIAFDKDIAADTY